MRVGHDVCSPRKEQRRPAAVRQTLRWARTSPAPPPGAPRPRAATAYSTSPSPSTCSTPDGASSSSGQYLLPRFGGHADGSRISAPGAELDLELPDRRSRPRGRPRPPRRAQRAGQSARSSWRCLEHPDDQLPARGGYFDAQPARAAQRVAKTKRVGPPRANSASDPAERPATPGGKPDHRLIRSRREGSAPIRQSLPNRALISGRALGLGPQPAPNLRLSRPA